MELFMQSHINGYDRDYLLYLIYHVKFAQHKKRTKGEYITFNLPKLEVITDTRIKRYIKVLEKCDILETNGKYIVGEQSKTYRLNPELLSDPVKVEISGESKLVKNLLKFYRDDQKRSYRLPEHLRMMREKFLNLDFDYVSMTGFANKNYVGAKLIYALNSIERLQDKRTRYFKINKTNGRLDTNLTNLPSELRNFISGNYVSIDAANSQIFLFNPIINIIYLQQGLYVSNSDVVNIVESFGRRTIQRILKKSQKSENCDFGDIYEFIRITTAGTFYERFMEHYPAMSRGEVKSTMFKVFYSSNWKKGLVPYKKEKEIFAEVFPTVYDIIYELKRKQYNLLAITMQKIESDLFIKKISKRLCGLGIVPLTIHDSIVVEREHEEIAFSIMNEVFKAELGMIPTFKPDYY